MAKPLGYLPPPVPDTAAEDAWRDLIAALHESGLLRAGAAGARAYPDLLVPVLQAVSTNDVRAALALAGALRGLDPDSAERLAEGVRNARTAAMEVGSKDKPEGWFAIMRRLFSKDTRRAVSAGLAAAQEVGKSLR